MLIVEVLNKGIAVSDEEIANAAAIVDAGFATNFSDACRVSLAVLAKLVLPTASTMSVSVHGRSPETAQLQGLILRPRIDARVLRD